MARNKNFTVEMNNGQATYYPAAAHCTTDHTTNKRNARGMTRAEADLFVQRINTLSTGVTGKVVPIA
jgi:hypothetical protein